MGFVRVDVESLEALPSNRAWSGKIVLEFAGPSFDGGRTLGFLKGLGSERQFCLNRVIFDEETAPLFSLPCFVKIDVAGRQEADLKAQVAGLRGLPVRTIATSVETKEDFERSFQAGFELFHGVFFREPGQVGRKSISPNHSLLLDLSLHTAREDDIQVIEAIFKKNPDLTFGLFNLVHSAFFRVSSDVTSIRQAIALLGYRDLHKWAALMLFTIDHSDPFSNPLFENVLVRARTMELLAGKIRKKGLNDAAYMTGVFSLVPVLFDVPIDEMVEKANFGEEIREALVSRTGNLGASLEIVERLEKEEYDKSEEVARTLGINMDFVLSAQSVAIAECTASSNGGKEEGVEARQDGGRPDGKGRSSQGKKAETPPQKGSWFRRFRSFFRLS
jgi:EAL and modified HD-GYP domain-containing signal transduction protein